MLESLGIWGHWQNLNKDDRGQTIGPPWSGRAWLYWAWRENRANNPALGIAWYLGRFSRHCGIELEWGRGDSESDVEMSLCIPRVLGLYITLECVIPPRLRPAHRSRQTGIYWAYGTLVIDLWHDWAGWGPRRQIRINPADILLGRADYSEHDLAYHEGIEVPMPEGDYPASVRLFKSIWKRPRWPWPMRLVRAEIQVPGGIPVPGKGENAWDCEDDAIYSLVTPVATVEDAIAALVATVIRRRERYGGRRWRPSTTPG